MIRETFYEDMLAELTRFLSNYIVERDANIFKISRLFYKSPQKSVKMKIATLVVTWDDNKPSMELVPTDATSVRDFQNLYRAFKGEEDLPIPE